MTDSFTTICYDYQMEFNLLSNEDQYYLTIWIKEGDSQVKQEESWTLYCEDHPISKYSDITVFYNNSNDPSLKFTQDHDSTSQKKLNIISIHNKSPKKIWVKIGPKDDEDTNDAKKESAGNPDTAFSPRKSF